MTDTVSAPNLSIIEPEFWWRPLADRMADFAVMREKEPFSRYEFNNIMSGEDEAFYAVTHYDDVVEISRRPQTFCSGKGSTSIVDMPAEALEFFGSFIVMDDPRHARQRGIVAREFTPRRLQTLIDSVEVICTELIDEICEQGEVDLVRDHRGPVPAPRDLRHDGHPSQRVQDGPRRHQHHPRRG